MAKWLYLFVPIGMGAVAFALFAPTAWNGVRQPLILALSLIGAAVLFRLARGFPVTDNWGIEVDEARKLTAAVVKVHKSLIVLFASILISIIFLAFTEFVMSTVNELVSLEESTREHLRQVWTGTIFFLVTYAIGRTIALVAGDYDLVKLQCQFFKRAVERRHANDRADDIDRAAKGAPFESREGYGKLRQ